MNHETKYEKIDVVVTATLRPEILNLTLQSFYTRFLRQFKQSRLIINIDPIGDKRYGPDNILKICRQYFKEVIYRCPPKPSFSDAVKWGWEQVENRIVSFLGR